MNDDLNALETMAEVDSTQDQLIIQQLKSEIKLKEQEIKALGEVERSYASVDSFLNKQDKSSSFDNFNYKVLQGEIKQTKSELEKLSSQKKAIESKRLYYADKLKNLQPSFTYLKILEEKWVQLELIKWTVVVDLEFDEHIGGTHRFKRTTLSKIIVFSAMISFFLVFIGILIRYVFDPRVYDVYEISKNFKGLDIIGNTPEFD